MASAESIAIALVIVPTIVAGIIGAAIPEVLGDAFRQRMWGEGAGVTARTCIGWFTT